MSQMHSLTDPQALPTAVSHLLGWAYFLCWSGSFYPQPVSNYLRKSTIGLAIDFPALNILGFTAYTVSTAAFLYSPTIRSQYADRHADSPEPTVRFNDFLFAAHGAVMCAIVYSQFFPDLWKFAKGRCQRISVAALVIWWGCVASVVAVVLLVMWQGEGRGKEEEEAEAKAWAWIDVIYMLGYVKLVTVAVKYIPQAWLNYQRKSTAGWSIYPMLLDFAGGWLSLAQLIIDSSLQNDWSGVRGNMVKLGLGNITILFDAIFILQHYLLYRHPAKSATGGVEDGSEYDSEYEPLHSAHGQ